MTPEDAQKLHELRGRYENAMHGVQSYVAYSIQALGDNKAGADHKHLRTGINAAMVSDEAVARLLIAKGVFTELEYYEALAVAAEEELARFNSRYQGVTFA